MNKIKIVDTKTGEKSIIVQTSSKEIRLHSLYNPQKEAQSLIKNFKAQNASHILCLGLGLGYQINEIKKKYPDKEIIIIEADKRIISLAKEHSPLFIKNCFIINSREELFNYCENLDLAKFKGVARFDHRPSTNLNIDFYNQIISDFNQYLSSKISDLLTRFEFEESWIKNIFKNINNLKNSLNVKDFFDKFEGYPGVIVSAGPTLRHSLPYLQKLKNKALIVAVDTSYKVLQNAGIEPHIVMVLDAQKYSQKHFTNISKSKTLLLADLVSCPSVLRDYPNQKIISNTAKYYTDNSGKSVRETTPTIDWFEKFIKPIGDLQSGGSVATSVFDFLLNCGCNEIIMIGQDLAYTGREIHCSGTYHNDDWLPLTNRLTNLDTINQTVIRRRQTKYIPAFKKCGNVISDFVFDLYRNWFEESSATVNIPVTNISTNGAFIKNTSEEDIKELLNRLPKKTKKPADIIDQLCKNAKFQDLKYLEKNVKLGLNDIKKINAIISHEEKEKKEKIILLSDFIDNSFWSPLYSPFLRKTKIYLARHQNLSEEKNDDLLYSDLCRITLILDELFLTLEKTLN